MFLESHYVLVATMSTENTLSIVSGSIVALLAVLSVVGGLIGSHRKMEMRVNGLHLLDISENTSVFLLRLSFLNNASVNRVVYDIVPTYKLDNVTVGKFRYIHDLSQQSIICQLPKREGLSIPISALSLPPLDIPPHQSLSTWVGVEIRIDPQSEDSNLVNLRHKLQEFPVLLNALDVYLKPIASLPDGENAIKISPSPFEINSTLKPPSKKRDNRFKGAITVIGWLLSDFYESRVFILFLLLILIALLLVPSLIKK